MVALITLAIYILGVWVAHSKLLHWREGEAIMKEEYQIVFEYSLLSWLIFPIYGIVWLFNEYGEN